MKRLQGMGWPVATGLMAALLIMQTLHYREPAPHTSPTSYADAVRRATPAVVNIYTRTIITERRRVPVPQGWLLFEQSRSGQSLGSGVIMTADGYILTNNHVISGASEIRVQLADGREAIARLIGSDPDTDLAVLGIDLPDLQPIAVGNVGAAEVGDVVLAIGNPYGVGQSVSQGIISATGGHNLRPDIYDNYIQTDAAINPGNSGGALLDTHGNLLGINTMIISRGGGSQGVGFAIPADYAIKALRDIVEHGSVERGWLGIEVQPLPVRIDAARETFTGMVVSDVEPGSPAQAAGVRPGDILLTLNGTPTNEGRNTMNRLLRMAPGDPFTLGVWRDGGAKELRGKLGQAPAH